ncbi:hypothetical protein [Stutzerimonas stutzeri]|uniref:Uncharacterized protein n=1 Tax=Stutzerimonas stutzeri KOS6 TaxID=1218352 RepID=A0A061JJ75_STUST|nr:hypothetical protein [Stutzerimonas stutzeri]EWC39067.1 hypothetical protein B597_022160 [Stutzerimonas stutzeri KOS6]
MALNTGRLRLEGERLVSSLHYAIDKVTLNGGEMSVPEFLGFGTERRSARPLKPAAVHPHCAWTDRTSRHAIPIFSYAPSGYWNHRRPYRLC